MASGENKFITVLVYNCHYLNVSNNSFTSVVFSMKPNKQTCCLLFLVFMCPHNSSARDVAGFEFGDNKGTKYVTEENGVAQVTVKES